MILPEEAGLVRDWPRPDDRRDAAYEAAFDRRTLVYDHWEDGGRLHMVCPRILNLWAPLRAGQPLRRRRYLRWEHVTSAPRRALRLGGLTLPLAPGAALHQDFAGLRVLMAVSKDNALDWIADWARHHFAAQGSNAVLLFDNGSTTYEAEAVTEALAGIAGLQRIRVIRAPYPYGPAGGKTGRLEVPGRFFQTAMFNLGRLRFLRQARSVLSVDIDEMVISHGTRSIHEAAERHPLGLARFGGDWIYSATPGGRQPQRAHDHRIDAPSPRPTKWCVAPSRAAGRIDWAVHRIFGPIDALATARDHAFLHCYQTSLGWKTPREGTDRPLLHDPALTALWARTLKGS